MYFLLKMGGIPLPAMLGTYQRGNQLNDPIFGTELLPLLIAGTELVPQFTNFKSIKL